MADPAAVIEATRWRFGEALEARPTRDDVLFPDKDDAEASLAADAAAIDSLQDALYAEGKRSLLIVLQGTDTSGKDGTVRGVFNRTGPLGVRVHGFGRPTDVELAHDYLWRVHQVVPRRGHIGIFNRSHYEDVLVVKVRGLAPADEVEQRYEQINAFERMLVENGTMIVKFMLNISHAEQGERLKARLEEPHKRWKFNAGDLEDRKRWSEYRSAYETMLERCHTRHAPWHVIPADSKTRRNAIIASIVRTTLAQMAPVYPDPGLRAGDFDFS